MTARLAAMSSGNGQTFRVSMSTWSDSLSMVAATQPSVGMADFHVVVQALLVEIDELERDADPVVQLEFALVDGVDLGREERGFALLQIILARGRQG